MANALHIAGLTGHHPLATQEFLMENHRHARALNYSIDHATGTVDLTLTGERFVVKTQGTGLLDKLRTIDIALTQLQYFCLLPTIGAQNLASVAGEGDSSYGSELVFSYYEGTRLKKKRGIFVDGGNRSFQKLLAGLEAKRPEASLLKLEPAEARKKIGVLSARMGLALALPAAILLVPAVGFVAHAISNALFIGLFFAVPLVFLLLLFVSKAKGRLG